MFFKIKLTFTLIFGYNSNLMILVYISKNNLKQYMQIMRCTMDDSIYYIQIEYKNSSESQFFYILFNYEETRNDSIELIKSLLELDMSERQSIHQYFKTSRGQLISLKNIVDITTVGVFSFDEIRDQLSTIFS